MSMKKGLLLFLSALLFFAVLLAGCGSQASEDKATSNTANSEAAMDNAAQEADQGSQTQAEASQANGNGSSAKEAPASDLTVTDQNGRSGYAATGAGTAPQPGEEDAIRRKVIYHANLTMEVEDYAAIQTEIRNMVALSKGYVLQFSDSKTLHEVGGQFVLKIPSGGFFSFITELEKLKPKLLQRSVEGQDVTEEYVDLSSRLIAKQAVETRLLKFMNEATRSEDLLKFSNALDAVQQEIEQIKGRMNYLDQNVSFSTIELRLYQRIEDAGVQEENTDSKPVLERAWNAMKTSGEWIGRFFEGLMVFVAGALPILVILGIVAVPGALWYRKKKIEAIRRRDNALKVDESSR